MFFCCNDSNFRNINAYNNRQLSEVDCDGYKAQCLSGISMHESPFKEVRGDDFCVLWSHNFNRGDLKILLPSEKDKVGICGIDGLAKYILENSENIKTFYLSICYLDPKLLKTELEKELKESQNDKSHQIEIILLANQGKAYTFTKMMNDGEKFANILVHDCKVTSGDYTMPEEKKQKVQKAEESTFLKNCNVLYEFFHHIALFIEDPFFCCKPTKTIDDDEIPSKAVENPELDLSSISNDYPPL
jgi:hypothetical protein